MPKIEFSVPQDTYLKLITLGQEYAWSANQFAKRLVEAALDRGSPTETEVWEHAVRRARTDGERKTRQMQRPRRGVV